MDMMQGFGVCVGREIVKEDAKLQGEVNGSGCNYLVHGLMTLESENVEEFFDGGETSTKELCPVLDGLDQCEANDPIDLIDYSSSDDFDYVNDHLDTIWDGRDAALIKSKRGKVKQCVIQDNYDQKEMTVVQCKKQYLGKRERRERIKLSVVKGLQIGLWSAAIGKRKSRRKVEKIAKAVAAFTSLAMFSVCWYRLKKLLSPQMYETFRHSVFSSVAKFVLSIFDVEDFDRVYNPHKINKKYAEFYSNLRHMKFDCDPMIAIAEGKMGIKEFSMLREHDVGRILKQYQASSNEPFLEAHAWLFNVLPYELISNDKSDMEIALSEMRKYVPLKEDRKIQLTLELMHAKSYHVFDTLFVEVWKGIKFQELVRYFANTLIDEKSDSVRELVHVVYNGMDPSEIANFELADFIHSMRFGLSILTKLKYDALNNFQKSVTFPLSCGVFGHFVDEVFEVVQIADHERRMQGHHFISVHHILFGLSLSRVGDCVQRVLNDRKLNCFSDEPSKIPMYIVYKLSGDAAKFFGDEWVQLEHLAMAIIYVKRENDPRRENETDKWLSLASADKEWDRDLLETLRQADSEWRVKSWEEDGLKKCLPEECFDGFRVTCNTISSVEKLIHAFESGLKLPTIR